MVDGLEVWRLELALDDFRSESMEQFSGGLGQDLRPGERVGQCLV